MLSVSRQFVELYSLIEKKMFEYRRDMILLIGMEVRGNFYPAIGAFCIS